MKRGVFLLFALLVSLESSRQGIPLSIAFHGGSEVGLACAPEDRRALLRGMKITDSYLQAANCHSNRFRSEEKPRLGMLFKEVPYLGPVPLGNIRNLLNPRRYNFQLHWVNKVSENPLALDPGPQELLRSERSEPDTVPLWYLTDRKALSLRGPASSWLQAGVLGPHSVAFRLTGETWETLYWEARKRQPRSLVMVLSSRVVVEAPVVNGTTSAVLAHRLNSPLFVFWPNGILELRGLKGKRADLFQQLVPHSGVDPTYSVVRTQTVSPQRGFEHFQDWKDALKLSWVSGWLLCLLFSKARARAGVLFLISRVLLLGLLFWGEPQLGPLHALGATFEAILSAQLIIALASRLRRSPHWRNDLRDPRLALGSLVLASFWLCLGSTVAPFVKVVAAGSICSYATSRLLAKKG